MKITTPSNVWLNELETRTRELAATVAGWTALPETALEQPPAPGAWSAAQCLGHLNSYGKVYLPAIQQAMAKANAPAVPQFTPGWLGAWFTRLLAPAADGKPTSKLPAPKAHSPVEADAHAELAIFAAQQESMLQLMEQARSVNLGRVRVPLEISSLIRLKLGDTFAFLVAHNLRHVRQAERALTSAKAAAGNVL